MPDFNEPARELDPGRRRGRPPGLGPRRLVGREQGGDRKYVLDVHQDQFLMLLLMMKPKLDKGGGLAPSFHGRLLDEPRHRGTDMVAIGADDVDRRTRQQPTLGSRMTGAGSLIIRVEEVGEGRVEDPITRLERGQDERLEEPGRMREMPLCRADIGHRLDRLVLCRRIARKRFTLGAYVCEPLKRGTAIAFGSPQLLGTVKHLIPQNRYLVPVNAPGAGRLR